MKMVEYKCGTRKEILEYLNTKITGIIDKVEQITTLNKGEYFQHKWNMVEKQIDTCIDSGSPLVGVCYNRFNGFGDMVENIREQFIVEDFSEISVQHKLDEIDKAQAREKYINKLEILLRMEKEASERDNNIKSVNTE